MREHYVTVKVLVDADLAHSAVKEYVNDAVSAWGGQYAPDDPLFSANIEVSLGKSGLMKTLKLRQARDRLGIPRPNRAKKDLTVFAGDSNDGVTGD